MKTRKNRISLRITDEMLLQLRQMLKRQQKKQPELNFSGLLRSILWNGIER